MTGIDDVAWVVAGVLAADGDQVGDLTETELRDRVGWEIGLSSRWMPGPITGDGLDRFVADAVQPVARWREPAPEAAAAVAARLGDDLGGFVRNPVPGWAQPVLRLEAGTLDDLAALRRKGSVAGIRLVPHVRWPARRVWWRWPMRVGLVDGPGAAGQVAQLTGDLTGLFSVEVVTAGAEAEVEVLVLAGPDGTVPDGVRAACIVVPGGGVEAIAGLEGAGPAAIVLTESADLTWFPRLIAELAHDQPLDVAAALAVPESWVLADGMLLPLTSVRVWALRLADDLARIPPETVVDGAPVATTVADLRRLVADGAFDMERRGGTELAGRVRAIDAARAETTIVWEMVHMAGAEPPGAPPPTSPAGEPDRGGGRGGEGPPAEAPPPDPRRLQARVFDRATKAAVVDRFLPGATYHVRVRIAAEVAADALAADAPFVSPTPGRAARLEVDVITGEVGVKRRLRLPAVGDSKWTRAVPVEVPTRGERFSIRIVVKFEGRTVQSWEISGPVLAAGAPAPAPGDGLRLTLDASTPPAAVHAMTPAGASFTIVPGLEGEPLLFDLAQTRAISPEGLAKATAKLRATLYAAFRAPPPASLGDAALHLARLALAGSPLYRQLGASAYDDAEWIHVSSFGGADVPVELAYTHPMPDDENVPVCPPALAGAKECAAGCPDRSRSDCVCPFGFWATSKVVERRAHTGDRTATTAGAQRAIPVLTVGAAGVSVKADEVDPTSTARILAAVESAIAPGGFHPVATWTALKPVAALPARLLVLITHTLPGDDPRLELGTELLAVDRIDAPYINPAKVEPGPVVLAIGCDTEAVETGFADYVGLLFGAGAELVVSAISPVPGKGVADFVVRFFTVLPAYLAAPGIHRFGEVLTAIRRQTVAEGDVLALALTASGDADVALTGP